MAPLVVRQPTVIIDFAGTAVDLSCYAYGVDIGSDVDTIDTGTFCTPNATDQGRVTETIVVNLLWEDALYALLQPHLGVEGHLEFVPSPAAGAKAIQADVKYVAMPWGAFTLGERVEADLTLSVLSPITYAVPVAVELAPAA